MIEKSFFAAANGYNGFRSYFDTVFNSEDFEKIYVLKGGPGTGKSSFMKAVRHKLSAFGCESESIYCSSDPKSLDGIICEKNGKKIAVLDGTAPHERDAVIPGAIDEIINLGTSWDARWLTAEKEKILKLNQEKKKAYKTAYSYLKICGNINREKEELAAVCRNSKKLKIVSNFTAEKKSVKNARVKTRLISSFGKLGSYRFDTLESQSDKIFSVNGNDSFTYALMNEIYEKLKTKNIELLHCPSPFDKEKTEAIYLPNENISYIIGDMGDVIYADEYFVSPSKADNERTRILSELYNNSLKEAERWFGIASDFHFRLEDIYSRTMNFDLNNKILEEKLSILCEHLDL